MKVVIRREGECHMCGWCCKGCLHLVPTFDEIRPYFYRCEIHDRRNEWCEKCGEVHSCEDDYPFWPNRGDNPHCGYRFFEEKSGLEILKLVYPDWGWREKHASK